MSGNRRRSGGVFRGDENNVSEGPGVVVGMIERRGEAKERDFGLEVVDLAFKLFLGFAGLDVALLAGASVAREVLFSTGDAAHRRVVDVGFGSALAGGIGDDLASVSPHFTRRRFFSALLPSGTFLSFDF